MNKFDDVILPVEDNKPAISSPVVAAKNDFDNVRLPIDEDKDIGNTKHLFEQAVDSDSDRIGAIERFAKEKNLPLEYVKANYDTISKMADTVPDQATLEETRANKPATYAYFKNPDNVKVSKDDFHKMGVFETAVSAFIDKNKPANIFDSIIDGFIPNAATAADKANEVINVISGQKQAVKRTLAMNRLSDLSERLQKIYDSTGRKVDMPNIDKEVKELQSVLAEQYPDNNNISDWLSPTTEIGSQMIFSLKAGAEKLPEYVPIGAAMGMGYGAMAGGVGAVPGTIAGAGIGAMAAMTMGGFDYSKKLEGSLAYLDFVNIKEKDGNYIDVAKAKTMAEIVGNINGTIEVSADIIGAKLLSPVVKLVAPAVAVKAAQLFSKTPGLQKVVQTVFDNPKYANMPFKKAIREAVKDMAIGAGSETGTEYLQNIISEMGANKLKKNNYTTAELLNKFNADYDIKNAEDVEKNYDTLSEHDKMLWNNRITSWPEIMSQSMQGLGSIFKGGFMLGAIGGVSKGITGYRAQLQQDRENNIKNNLSKLSAADSKTEQLQAIGDIAKDIKTVSRSPEKTEQFVQNIVSGSAIDNIYIDAEKLDILCQTAKIKKDELINKLGIDAEQFNVDSKISANIKVPFAKWVSVATQIEMPEGKNLYEVALGDIKDSEDGISQNEKTEIFNEQKTALDQALKRAEEFTTEEDINTKNEVETFYNTLLDEAQPEGMREDIWQKQKEGIVKLYTAQALTEMKNRGWNYVDWLDNKKMGNLRVKNNMSVYRADIKSSAKNILQEIADYEMDLQNQLDDSEDFAGIIDLVIQAGGIKFDSNLAGEKNMLKFKETGIKGLINDKGISASHMAERLQEITGKEIFKSGKADEVELVNAIMEDIPKYKKQKTRKIKKINFFNLKTNDFKKSYEKIMLKSLPEEDKSMRILHQDLIREAIKQGVPVEKNVLEELNINPQYVDKRKFESAIKDENLFNSDNYFQSAEFKNRENKIFERFNKFLNKEIIAIQPNKILSKKEAEKIFKNNKNVKHNELGNTVLPVETVNKILRHKGFDTSTIIDYISDLYRKSILIDTQTEKQYAQEHKQHNNITLWHNTLNKFKINNDNYVIRFTVAERKVGENKKKGTVGERYLHSTFISNIDIEKIKDGNTMNTSNNLGRVLPSDNILADYIKIVNNKLFQGYINTKTPEFKKWFGDSKVVNDNGEPLVVYHGSKRVDRIGNIFDHKKATSGPMAYFTTDPEIASSYATGKEDTSNQKNGYEDWFLFKKNNKDFNLIDYGKTLTEKENQKIFQKLKEIDIDDNNIFYKKNHKTSIVPRDHIDYLYKYEAKHNALHVAQMLWLDSGILYDREEKFFDVLKYIGITNVKKDFPSDIAAGVYPVYLSIKNPLNTLNIPNSVLKKLELASKKKESQAKHGGYGVDIWDKNTRDAKEWIKSLKEDMQNKVNSFVWTSIPDWTTQTLKQEGFDGIQDIGNKTANGKNHNVWIPFSSTQIKSINNRGTFDVNNPDIYKQGADEIVRGYITKDNEINILPHSDASTFIHEMGHYWLRDLQKYINENQAPAQVQKDWEIIKQWLGIQNDNDVITTQQQEIYAKAIEQYMMEGKAPTRELKSVFRKIASWIKYIYKKLVFSNVKISEDIKNYFDRLFATEDEIAYSNDKVLYNFDKELAGADPEIKAGFDEMRKEAHDQAVEILLPETMKELSAEFKANIEEKKKQFTEEATAEIKQSAVYKASEQIKKNFKKNIDIVIKLYNDNKLTDENIIDLNLTAEDYGYTSGDHLIKDIEKLGNAEEQINNLVNQKMQDYNETISSPEFLEAEATRALHNEKALDLIALERELLINKYYKKEISMLSATTKAQAYKNMAKEKAREILENLPVKEAMRFQKYFVAEKKTAQRYAAAMAKNDIENALKYKQQMLIDFALVKESIAIKNEYLKIEAKLKKVSQRDIKLFGNEENFSQVANILERFRFYHKDYYPEYRKQSLADYAESINTWIDFDNTKKTEARIVIDPFVLNENNKGPLKDLSIDEVEAIEQSVDNIIHYVNNENKTTKVLQGQDIDMVVRDAVEQLQKNVPKELQKKNTKLNSQRDFEKQISLKDKFVKSFIMPGIKLDSVLKVADGYKDGGLFYQLFGRPVKEAMDQEAQMARDIFQKYTESFKNCYDETERKNFFAEDSKDFEKKKIYVDQFKNSFTREELIAIALNMGNESNRERLFATPIIDYKGSRDTWGADLINDVLSKNLTEKDWQFVQSIWDLLEEYGEKHFDMHKRITGFSPVKIKAVPFTAVTKDGKKIELKGGYYPLAQDKRSDEKVELRIEARKPEYEANIFTKPTTKKGRLLTRKKNAKYPVQVRLFVFEQALADTIHDIAFRELLFDLNRITAKKEFKDGVKNTLGAEAYKKFADQVRACGIIQNVYQDNEALNRIIGYYRSGVGASVLALKPGILFQNLANVFIYKGAMDRFGAAEEKLLWIKTSTEFKDLLFNTEKGKAIREFVYSKSSMMQDRQENIDYTFSQAEKCLFGKKDKLLQFANLAMVYTDNITALPAWQIMYEKAINDGLSDKDAINEADLLITRVVGNGRRLDQAEFVRSTNLWIKLINPFSTFMINMLNMWYLQSGKAIDFKKYKEFAKFTVTQLFIFAIVSEIFSGRPPAEMDSGDEWAKWILTTMGGYIISMLPFIRSFFPGIMEMAVDGKNRSYGRNVSPVFDSINKGVVQPGVVAVKGINKILTTNKYKKGELQNDLETMTEGALVNYRLPKIVGAWFWNLYDMFDKGMTPKVSDAFKRRPRKERKGNKMFKI